MPQPHPSRILSVDILRGLVVILMIFVNDLASALNTPRAFLHLPESADGMSVADLVFPAFLFIAGMSVPLALGKVHAGVLPVSKALIRLLARVASLLAMGVVMVNGDAHDPWARGLWATCAYACLLASFCVVPESEGGKTVILRWLRRVGACGLCVLAWLHCGADGVPLLLAPLRGHPEAGWLQHSWWGILGQIGWAWGMAALIYLFAGRRRESLLAGVFLLVLLYPAMQAGLADFLCARPWLAWLVPTVRLLSGPLAWIDAHVGLATTLGTLSALTLAGTCLGSVLAGSQAEPEARKQLHWALGFGCVLFLAGLLLDAPHGIGKIRATPSFVLYCGALTSFAWAGLFAWLDLRGGKFPVNWVRPAGESPLLAYLLHPLLCLLIGVAGPEAEHIVFFYRQLPWWGACAGALASALLVVRLTGYLSGLGFRLKV